MPCEVVSVLLSAACGLDLGYFLKEVRHWIPKILRCARFLRVYFLGLGFGFEHSAEQRAKPWLLWPYARVSRLREIHTAPILSLSFNKLVASINHQ